MFRFQTHLKCHTSAKLLIYRKTNDPTSSWWLGDCTKICNKHVFQPVHSYASYTVNKWKSWCMKEETGREEMKVDLFVYNRQGWWTQLVHAHNCTNAYEMTKHWQNFLRLLRNKESLKQIKGLETVTKYTRWLKHRFPKSIVFPKACEKIITIEQKLNCCDEKTPWKNQ